MASGHNVNIESFFLRQLDVILSLANNGRSQELKNLRDACQTLKDLLRGNEFGQPGSCLSVPFTDAVTEPLISVLRSSLAQGSPKFAEPALACLHKLVAYAYLQGETRASGRLDDASNLVTSVVGMTAKAANSHNAQVELAVVKTMLTLATAEHFASHGDTLMQAVRTVFNIAVGGASEDVKNTARSALLQMLNTIAKRVVQQIVTPGGTPMMSPLRRFTPRDEEEGGSPPAATWPLPAVAGASADLSSLAAAAAFMPDSDSNPALAEAAALAAFAAGGGGQSPRTPITATAGLPFHPPDQPAAVEAAPGSSGKDSEAAASAAAAQQRHLEDTRTAQLASLAEQADLRGLEMALDSLAPLQGAEDVGLIPPTAIKTSKPAKITTAITAAAAAAIGISPRGEKVEESESHGRLPRVDTPPDPRRALMRDRRAAEWRRLTVPERDAVIVLNAMCKLAARETGIGAAETYMHTGKLLALDMLVKVLTNPAHDWNQVRREFAQQLRQPLCRALLRNCMSPYDEAVDGAVSILGAILSSPRLREFLKAEVGALYPLLLLRPLEAEVPDSPHQVLAALRGLGEVCTSAQVLVDVFVNYDCNLQAANLFERTAKVLSKYVILTSGGSGLSRLPLPTAALPKARSAALKALLAAVKSIDTWAGPLKTTDTAIVGENRARGSFSEDREGDMVVPLPAYGDVLQHDVLHRIQTDKAIKAGLEGGVYVFNRNPAKGLAALVESGAVGRGPVAAATFLRAETDRLDPGAVGELLGEHAEENIAVMHAYVNGEDFSGLSVDAALRRLLVGFRLPGEAQKIDRIVEKFAERYCADNPGKFPTADAPYLLAFAIIMLNTDAHNPMAEGRISVDDFVTMCVFQDERGEFRAILPADEVKELYRRVVAEEIAVRQWPPKGVEVTRHFGSGATPNGESKESSSKRARLAAAVGLSQLAAPFWAGASWDKQHGVDVERRRLLELTGQLLEAGSVGGGGPGWVGGAGAMWHVATHAEHARPMMQVCGVPVSKALSAALEGATSLLETAAALDGYEQAVRLAALLRLEQLCETLVAGLAAAAYLGDPAPPHTPQEARQVATLSRLVSLGSCGEAGALGSAWVVLLRALSELEALKTDLTAGVYTSDYRSSGNGSGGVGSPSAAAAAAQQQHQLQRSGSGISHPRPTTSPPSPPSPAPSSLSRLFARVGLGGGGSAHSGAADVAATTIMSEHMGPLSVRASPGMGAVLWAETSGAVPVDKIFTHSAGLDGDAVLTFFRALAAVSQEELDPGVVGVRPRVYLLQRLVEAAFRNVDRIRLVWQRLWTVVSQHLVSAACHSDPYVAMYAVDALRQLADRLLCRAELAGFTSQGDALRPFTAVLRCSDSPPVRELAVACVSHAVTAHGARIGSGWRCVIEALAVAAADPAPAVVAQALDAMSGVFNALYEGEAGHGCLRESVAAALAAIAAPTQATADLAPTALYMFQTLARRLAEATSAPSSSSAAAPTDLPALRDAWLAILGPLAAVARADSRPAEADTAAAVLFQILQAHADAFPPELWPAVFDASIAPLLALTGRPPNPPAAPSAATPVVQRRPTPRLTVSLPMASAEQQSVEGVKRVLRHAETHLPDVWGLVGGEESTASRAAEVGVPLFPRAEALLPPALRLVRSYAEAEEPAAAALGARQLHELLREAGPRLGLEGWHYVETTLADMVCAGATAVNIAAAQPALNFEPSQSAEDAAAAAESLGERSAFVRHACRVSLLAVRCVAELLQKWPESMPIAVQSGLFAALEAAVESAAAVNSDPSKRAALALLIQSPPAVDARMYPSFDAPAPLHANSPTNGNAPARTALYGSVSIAGPWDAPLQPALIRHEVEGGLALLAALQRCAQHPAASDCSGPEAVEGLQRSCQARLAARALKEVHAAAARVQASPALERILANGSTSGSTTPATPTGKKIEIGWEDALRAPLVRDSLLMLCDMPAEAWGEARREVFAQAARLVCSPELLVRRAVQQLMRSQGGMALAAAV